MEGEKGREQMTGANEVVVVISGTQEASMTTKQSRDSIGLATFELESPNAKLTEHGSRKRREQLPTPTSSNSHEITELSPMLNISPKVSDDTVTQQKSESPSVNSKRKSRLVDPSYSSRPKLVVESTRMVPLSSTYRSSPNMASPSHKGNESTPKENVRTPSMGSVGGEDDKVGDDDEVYKTANLQEFDGKLGKKLKVVIIIEWIVFVCMMGVLIASLTVHKLRNHTIWGLQIWKWCVLVLVIFCGRLATQWFINFLVFLIERNFLLKKKVLYFLYGLKRSVQCFTWLGLVLLAWALLINRGVKGSRKTTMILNYITRALASSLIGAVIWMVKTLLLKLLAASFHVKTFFDRIQESIFHQYVLQTLSGPPLMEYGETSNSSRTSGQLSFKSMKKGKQVENEEVIDVDKLHKMKREKVSAWTMRGLIKVIESSGLSTIFGALDDSVDDDSVGKKDKEIASELEAKAAANQIFKNVAKPDCKYIDEEDLLRFMTKEEVDNVLPQFVGAVEMGKIKKSSLRNWVVNVYNERKCLALSLNDSKTAIEDLNKIVTGIVLIMIPIVWLLLMGFVTTHVLVFISSQILLVAFVFGNTCKTVFEAIIFVFVTHPFDTGDRCVVDGVQMVVEEMNILTTIFLRYDNEKIFYPNSLLANKPISNFNRSPEMSEAVEFAIDVSTSAESIAALKAKIKSYLEGKPKNWRPNHSLQLKEIEDMNKMKMVLYVTHTMNFQNYREKSNRKSELAFELKKIFEELGIKYKLLP